MSLKRYGCAPVHMPGCVCVIYPYGPRVWWVPTGILSRLDQAALPSHHIWAFVLCFGTAEMTEPSFNPSMLLLTGQVGG